MLVGVAVLGALLSCGSGEDSPTLSPVATATPTTVVTPTPASPSATPPQTATATPVATATATPTATATRAPAPSPMPTPTPEPTPPPVTVTGPLLLISERLGLGDVPEDPGSETWRLFVYDVALDRYWSPFDYRILQADDTPFDDNASTVAVPPVQVAGASLVVWSDGQVRRVALNGELELILFEHSAIRRMLVSPDGAKVAILYEPGNLLVLDVVSGRHLLEVIGDDPVLDPLRDGGQFARLYLGRWHADSNAISVVTAGHSGLTAIVGLDGDAHVLPQQWTVSSDLRYALQFRDGVELGQHTFGWKSIDVFDVATGNLAATISSEEGLEVPYGRFYWVHGEEHVAFGSQWIRSHWELPRGLDTEGGEVKPLSRAEQWRFEGPVQTDCYPRDFYGDCDVRYDRRVVWEGADGWTRYLALVELAAPLQLDRGTLREAAPEPPLAPPPSREEMVGPLLVYEIKGEYRSVPDNGGGLRETVTKQVVVFDEGTGRSWSLYNNGDTTQVARGGLVRLNAALTPNPFRLHYVSPDGQSALLDDSWVDGRRFLVSPDGRKVAIRFYGGGLGPDGLYNPARTVVLDIPSGDEVLRVVHGEIPSAVGLLPATAPWTVWGLEWTSDSSAVVLEVVADDMGYGGPTVTVIAGLDGTLHLVPCPVGDSSASANCYAPDGRHVVRGRSEASGEYTQSGWYNWRNLDIIDSETEEVLWSVESSAFVNRWDWQWASPDHVAWSEDLLHRVYPDTFAPTASRADVSVLDIRTGETELLDIDDYLARFHSPRATTDCPENPGRPCRILLDGEVVGEGRWPTIIGFVELD